MQLSNNITVKSAPHLIIGDGIDRTYSVVDNLLSTCHLTMTTIRCLLSDINISEYINFETILTYQILDMPFIKQFYNKIVQDNQLDKLFQFQAIDEDFILLHMDEIISLNNPELLVYIARFQKLSLSFIQKYADKLPWGELFKNPNITFSINFVLKNMKYLKKADYKQLIYMKNFESMCNKLLKHIDIENIDALEWGYISWNVELDEENILNNLKIIDFNSPLLKSRKFNNDNITCYRVLEYGF